MSGASLPCCRVCGGRVKVERDYMEHVQMEESCFCSHCLLYSYNFYTGVSRQRYGFCEWGWSWMDEVKGGRWEWIKKEMEAAYEEVYRLWRDPDYSQWRHVIITPDDLILWGVFADWCAERGHTITERAVRERVG